MLTPVLTPSYYAGSRIPNINQFPILNKNEASKELEIPFQKDCGADDECQAQLAATLSLHDEHGQTITSNILGRRQKTKFKGCVNSHPFNVQNWARTVRSC